MVLHICNPSHLGGRDRRIASSRPTEGLGENQRRKRERGREREEGREKKRTK
jgi:hypothetical protein